MQRIPLTLITVGLVGSSSLITSQTLPAEVKHRQIQIETRFVEIDQTALDDFGILFDTRKQRDGTEIDATLRAGYEGNILGTALSQQKRGSSFISLGINASFKLTDYWRVSLGATEKQYDRTILSRPNSDSLIHDYRLNSNIDLKITPTLRLTNDIALNVGGSGRTSLNDVRTGILERDRTWFRMLSSLYFRPNGGAHNDPGIRLRLRHRGTIYNQSGDDRMDVHAFMLGLELAYIMNPQLTFFLSAAHVERNWRYYDFDSCGYLVAAGAYGIFPCGVYYYMALNHERRHYRNSSIDDRHIWGYSLLFYNTIRLWQWGVYCNYGFMDPNLPNNTKLNLADAEGKRAGAYLTRRFADVWLASVYCHILYLNGQIFNTSDIKTHYFYTGVGLKRDIGDDAEAGINVGVQRVRYNTNTNDSETSHFAELFYRRNF